MLGYCWTVDKQANNNLTLFQRILFAGNGGSLFVPTAQTSTHH